MSFKRDNKKLKNILLVAALCLIAAVSLIISILPNQVDTTVKTKGYKINAEF